MSDLTRGPFATSMDHCADSRDAQNDARPTNIYIHIYLYSYAYGGNLKEKTEHTKLTKPSTYTAIKIA